MDGVELNHAERGQLCAILAMPGWKVLQHKIMEPEVRKFELALINTDVADRKRVLANHVVAKTAAQVIYGIIQRINGELELYKHAPRAGDKPERAAENIVESSPEQQ